MHVITRKHLHEFAKKHPDCGSDPESWYKIVKPTKFASFAELKQTFPSTDQVGKFTVFNIGRNQVRLIAAVRNNTSRIYIRHVLTHKEYDWGTWKEK